MVSPRPEKSKIVELESLRGLAALLVVLNHIPLWTANSRGSNFVGNGYLMVDFFFVLSGFVICRNYIGKIKTGMALLRFQFLRFGRLYPVHLLMLFLFLILEASKYYLNSHTALKTTVAEPFSINTWNAFFQQLLLLQAVGPTGNALTFNAPAWSISVEFYTYLVFAFVSAISGRWTTLVAASIAAASVVLLQFFGIETGYSEILRCFAGFFIGCCVSALCSRTKAHYPASFAGLAIFAFALFLQLRTDRSFGGLVYLLSALVIFCVSCSKPGLVRTVLGARWLEWLGAISYSLYMSHWLVVYLFDQVLRRILKFPAGANHVLKMPADEAWLFSLLAVGVCLVCAYIMHRFVESPFRTRSRRFVLASEGRPI